MVKNIKHNAIVSLEEEIQFESKEEVLYHNFDSQVEAQQQKRVLSVFAFHIEGFIQIILSAKA